MHGHAAVTTRFTASSRSLTFPQVRLPPIAFSAGTPALQILGPSMQALHAGMSLCSLWKSLRLDGSCYGPRALKKDAQKFVQILGRLFDQVNHAASGRHSTVGSKCLRANPACRWLQSGSSGHQGLASKGAAGHQKAAAGGRRHLPATLPQRRPDGRQRSRCCA